MFYFLMLINTWQFHLPNWQGVGAMWAISISFVYIELLVSAFSQSNRLNLNFCLKSSVTYILLSAFYMVDKTQMSVLGDHM